MREILFKVWYPDEQIMMIPKVLNIDSIGKDGGIWLEFTGKVDKNGARVFDGDIITYKFKTKTSNDQFTSAVFFDEYMWLTEDHSINRINDVEVIGNIYQHPELIEKPVTQ